ncbi:hypothetical protein ABTH92_20235, partial [Acinetobacter baumannii]
MTPTRRAVLKAASGLALPGMPSVAMATDTAHPPGPMRMLPHTPVTAFVFHAFRTMSDTTAARMQSLHF